MMTKKPPVKLSVLLHALTSHIQTHISQLLKMETEYLKYTLTLAKSHDCKFTKSDWRSKSLLMQTGHYLRQSPRIAHLNVL